MLEPRYFVLEPYAKYPRGHAARQAMLAFADEIVDDDSNLADDLIRWARNCYRWEGSNVHRENNPYKRGSEPYNLFAEGKQAMAEAVTSSNPNNLPGWVHIDPLLTVFVLKPRGNNFYARASREAMLHYAKLIEQAEPDIAKRLRQWVSQEQEKIASNNVHNTSQVTNVCAACGHVGQFGELSFQVHAINIPSNSGATGIMNTSGSLQFFVCPVCSTVHYLSFTG